MECVARTKGGATPTAKVLADLTTADVTSRQLTPSQAYAALGLSAADSGLVSSEAGADVTAGARKPLPKRAKEPPRLDAALVAKATAIRRVRLHLLRYFAYSSLVWVDLCGVLLWRFDNTAFVFCVK